MVTMSRAITGEPTKGRSTRRLTPRASATMLAHPNPRAPTSPRPRPCHPAAVSLAANMAQSPSAKLIRRDALQTYLPPPIFTDPSENEGISLIFALRCSHVKREVLLYCLEYVWYIQTHVYHRCSPSQLSPGYSPTRVLSRRGQGAYADPRQPALVGTGADRGPAPRPQG